MIRSGILAALFGVWAVSLPNDLHVAQRALLVAGVVPLLRIGYHLWRRRIVASRVLILGNGPIVSKLIEELESSPTPRYVLTGVLDNQPLREDTRALWLGRLDRLAVMVDQVRADRINDAGWRALCRVSEQPTRFAFGQGIHRSLQPSDWPPPGPARMTRL